jgi:arginase
MPRHPLQLLLVPYDSGHRGTRMGDGPDHLLRHGIASALRAAGTDVQSEYIESAKEFRTEVATHFELCTLVAERVSAAVRAYRRPIVLSGNCGIALGTLAGLASGGIDDVGIVWLDAHGEFNTPDTTASGFLDGMGLTAIAGRSWKTIASSVTGFTPTPEERIVLAGLRDLDEAEGAALGKSGLRIVRAEMVRDDGLSAALEPALAALARRVRTVYLHIDLDVLDPLVGRANLFAPAGGLTRGELIDAVRLVGEHLKIAGAGIASYDPAYDADGAVFSAAVAAVDALAEAPVPEAMRA